MKMLLVDDDATFLSILQKGLQHKAVYADIATSSEQALELCRTQEYERAVVDLNIDGESGLNLLKQLLVNQPDCQVLLLTGYASVATAVEAMRLGAVNYLCKPAKVEQILQAFTPEEVMTVEPPQTESAEFESMSVKRLEWEHIQRALMEHDGNISATAKALNMHRRTLQRKLNKRPVEK